MSRKFTIKGHLWCSLLSNIFPNPLFLLSTPNHFNFPSLSSYNTTLYGESTFDIWLTPFGAKVLYFLQKKFKLLMKKAASPNCGFSETVRQPITATDTLFLFAFLLFCGILLYHSIIVFFMRSPKGVIWGSFY